MVDGEPTRLTGQTLAGGMRVKGVQQVSSVAVYLDFAVGGVAYDHLVFARIGRYRREERAALVLQIKLMSQCSLSAINLHRSLSGGYDHVMIPVYSDVARFVARAEHVLELVILAEDLNPLVLAVGHHDAPIGHHCHVCWLVEFFLAFALLAELVLEECAHVEDVYSVVERVRHNDVTGWGTGNTSWTVQLPITTATAHPATITTVEEQLVRPVNKKQI